MTLADLLKQYGTTGRAAGAVAIGRAGVTTDDFMLLPEYFRSLVLYKQQTAILRLAAVAAGSSYASLQRLWDNEDTHQQEKSEVL